tara:strand:+ start:87 stop:1001 length:915 start_codon:yes stop_codon:yes gene_type:complete
MAKSIASLFGPSAEEIVYDRNQAERIRQQAQLQQSLAGQENRASRDFYESGYNMATGAGRGLAGLFGYSEQIEDPRIAKSLKLRQILGNTGVDDLNDETKLAALSASLGKEGLTREALYFADREKEVKKYNLEVNKLGTITPVKDFVLADGTPVGQNGYGQWSTLNGEPVSVSQLVTEKTYLAGAAAGTKDVTAGAESDIELTLLSDIDLKKEDKEALARRIEQEADKILDKKGNKLTREEARKNAFENLKETKVLRKTDRGLYPLVKGAVGLDTDLPYFQDWQYVPEGTGTVLKPGFRIVAED